MKKPFKLLFLIFNLFALFPSMTQAKESMTEFVLTQYRTLLLQRHDNFISPGNIQSMEPEVDGHWSDIDYKDTNGAGWKPAEHLERTYSLAKAYFDQTHPLHQDEALLIVVNRALDYWLNHRFQCPNWWWNQIGVPRLMRDLVILLEPTLTPERKAGIVEVVGQHKLGGTGANLTWSAELALHHGCLTQNTDQVRKAANAIWNEVKVASGDEEGIQADHSFHQHGARLQTFHYGKSYLDATVTVAWQLRNTEWELPEEKRQLLADYILEGPQWMSRYTYTVPGTLDRSVSRKDSLEEADLRFLLKCLRDLVPSKKEAIDAFIAHQSGSDSRLSGYRHFPRSDFSVYYRPTASIFLKTLSDRTRITESINGENRKGVPYLNSGDLYILESGIEYANLQPLWKWHYLPGITVPAEEMDSAPKSEQVGQTFTGGLGNGESGFSVMDYLRTSGQSEALHCRKAWFFHQDIAICLIGGWAHESEFPRTSLEQSKVRGPITARLQNLDLASIEQGQTTLKSPAWVLHQKIGYIPLNPSEVELSITTEKGSWASINKQYSESDLEETNIFTLLLNHGATPESTGYVIDLNATEEKLDGLVRKPLWRILRNDQNIQAVQFENGLTMAAFYKANTKENSLDLGVSVDTPCLALWNDDQIWLCDPTNQGQEVNLHWKTGHYQIALPSGGNIISLNSTAVSL